MQSESPHEPTTGSEPVPQDTPGSDEWVIMPSAPEEQPKVQATAADRSDVLATPPTMDQQILTPRIAEAASHFERVDLQAALNVSLLDRVDTKVVASVDQVSQVLNVLNQDFKIVEIAGSIAPGYRSVYYDTALHELYNDHHNGKRIRYKIRYRTYLSTDTTFFEVKMRNDSRRTVKHRIRVPWIPQEFGEPEKELLERLGVPTPGARPTLDIEYHRVTLLGTNERVTVDLGLTCTAQDSWVRFDRVAIIEAKQPRLNLSSPAFSAMREAGLRPGSISKYCVGVATCVPGVKTNRFKSRLRQLGALEMSA